VILFSELASNLATAATLLPLLFEVARALEVDPLLLTVPAIVGASCGFMLPVATPPNAIAFGTGYISVRQMMRAGIWLDLAAVVLVPIFVYTLGSWALGMKW
jgi:sodium-dependent dicarboxylate transporter 2/3/5